MFGETGTKMFTEKNIIVIKLKNDKTQTKFVGLCNVHFIVTWSFKPSLCYLLATNEDFSLINWSHLRKLYKHQNNSYISFTRLYEMIT